VGVLILSMLVSGCSAVEHSSAVEVENTVATTTIIEEKTVQETTNLLNYDPTLTVCPPFEPSETEETITETATETTTEYTNTSIDDTYETTLETSEDVTSISTMYHKNTSYNKHPEVTTPEPTPLDSSYFFQDCAFIGDSLTVGMSAYELIPKDYTFAQEGVSLLAINSLQIYTNYGYAYPPQAISYWQPKHVYILLGINGVTWVSNDTAIENYTQLINSILSYNSNIEDINIISVLPVSHAMETIDTVENGRILNSEIDSFNERLKTMAHNLNVNYIDANSILKDSSGCLPDDLTVDGLHLTESGYQKVINVLLENAQEDR